MAGIIRGTLDKFMRGVENVLLSRNNRGRRRVEDGGEDKQEEEEVVVLASVPSPPLGTAMGRDQEESRMREQLRQQRAAAADARARNANAATGSSEDFLAAGQRRRAAAAAKALEAKQRAKGGEQPERPSWPVNMLPGMGGGGVGFGSFQEHSDGDGRRRRGPVEDEAGATAAAAAGGGGGDGAAAQGGNPEEEGKWQRAVEGGVVDVDAEEEQDAHKKPAAPAPASVAAPAADKWASLFTERRISGEKRQHPDANPPVATGIFGYDDDEEEAKKHKAEMELATQLSLQDQQQRPPMPMPPPPPERKPAKPFTGPVRPPSMSAAAAASSRGARSSGTSPATGGGGGPGGLSGGARRIPIHFVSDSDRAKKRPRQEQGPPQYYEPAIGPPRPPPEPQESGGAAAARGGKAPKSKPKKQEEVIELSGDEAEAEAEEEAEEEEASPRQFIWRKQPATAAAQEEPAGGGKMAAPRPRQQQQQQEDEDEGDCVQVQLRRRGTRSGRAGAPLPLTAGIAASAASAAAAVDLSDGSPRGGLQVVDDEVAILEPTGAVGSRTRGKGPAGAGARAGKAAAAREPTDEEVEAMVAFESCMSFMLQQAAELSDPLMAHGAGQQQQQQAPGQPPPNFFQFTSEEALKDVALRLLKDELLSDEILNRAIDLLAHLPQARDCVLFNTFWYEKLKDGRYDEAGQWLRRALRGRDANSLRLVLVPVNVSNAHWVLVFVDLVQATVQVQQHTSACLLSVVLSIPTTPHHTTDPSPSIQPKHPNTHQQEWDPASAECMLDHSRVRNVQDAVEKALRDVLERRHPNFTRLRLRTPPRGLPQQADAINCGLFVVLFSIHLVFRPNKPSDDAVEPFPALPPPPAAEDDIFGDSARRRSRRLEGIATTRAHAALDSVPVCCFKHGADDLYKYRLMLLAWILHSQTSQLPWTEPVLLYFIRAPVGVPAEDLGYRSEDPNNKALKRKLLLALLRDDAPATDRAELLRAGMQLLKRFHQGGVVNFLPPQWFELARNGRHAQAREVVEEEVTDAVEQLCAPILLPAKQGCLLARISLTAELQTVYLHGSHALAHAEDAVIPPVNATLKQTVSRGDDFDFLFRQVVATQVPEARMEEVAVLLMAMQVCKRGSACRESEELFPGQAGGPDLSSDERFFAARLGLLRWFLRHTSWVG